LEGLGCRHYFAENLFESLYIDYPAGDHYQVITSIRPTKELNLEIHKFVKSRKYKALKTSCLDIGRHVIDTRSMLESGSNEGFVLADEVDKCFGPLPCSASREF
jgi:hypothetical protein